MTYRGFEIKVLERREAKLPGWQWIASKGTLSGVSVAATKPAAISDAKRFIDEQGRAS